MFWNCLDWDGKTMMLNDKLQHKMFWNSNDYYDSDMIAWDKLQHKMFWNEVTQGYLVALAW